MRRVLALAVLLAAWGGVELRADFAQNIYRGLELFATPSGYPLVASSDGTVFNGARSGRLRIMPNGILGNGYRLELDRTFGVDSRGRPETLRFGGFGELSLSGGMQATAGYMRSGHLLAGELGFVFNNLSYNVVTKSGLQDIQLTGTLQGGGTIDINEAGFYSINIDIGNVNSRLIQDGVVIEDRTVMNFDVGPIAIEGNLYFDAVVALLNAVGVDTTALEGIFPKSPIDLINDAIDENLQSFGVVAGDTGQNAFAPLLLQSVLGRDPEAAQALMDGLADGTIDLSGSASPGAPSAVPEPGPLLVLLIGGTLLRTWQRRI